MTPMDAGQARRVLDRLKRGVPPVDGLDDLSVGLSKLHSRIDGLLTADAQPRWCAVLSDYGEGKSHFQLVAMQRALRAGYAVATLAVNKDEGALHQPQRHLAPLLSSVRSPLADYRHHLGVSAMVRDWLERTHSNDVVAILRRCSSTTPWIPAGRDRGSLAACEHWIRSSVSDPWAQGSAFHWLLRYMGAEDLVGRSIQGRFAAAYRLQVVQHWLRAVGHKGLFVFIDEVDNVQRQIHGKGHPGCYRSLAWYCSWGGLVHVRTVFASTPEGLNGINGEYGDWVGQRLSEQKTVLQDEADVYRTWLEELRTMSKDGWLACPRLSVTQRVELFDRIRRVHEVAWCTTVGLDDEVIEQLARQPQFVTTRRWVRAIVQVLDLLQQHGSCPGTSSVASNASQDSSLVLAR